VPATGFAGGVPAPVRQVLAECRYFHLEFCRDARPFAAGGQGKLQLLIVVAGRGQLGTEDGVETLTPGQAWVLPAAMKPVLCQPETSLSCLVCTLPG
jgi:hypothetical protein